MSHPDYTEDDRAADEWSPDDPYDVGDPCYIANGCMEPVCTDCGSEYDDDDSYDPCDDCDGRECDPCIYDD